LLACVACNSKQKDKPEEPPEPPVKLEAVDDEYRSRVKSVLGTTLALTMEDEKQLPFLAPALPIPKVVNGGTTTPKELIPFYTIPTPDTAIFKPGNRDYVDQLMKIADRVQLGKVKLTGEQTKAVAAAKTLLYEEGDAKTPSEAYVKYKVYEKEYNELIQSLKSAMGAERIALQNKLTVAERDWKLFGKKAEISQALATLGSVDAEGTKKLFESWKKAVEAERKPDASELWMALAEQTGWVTVTFSLPIKPGRALTAQTRDKDGKEESILIGGMKQVTLKVARVRVRHPALEHPFLRSRLWRVDEKGDKSVISEGDFKLTKNHEIAPWVVSELIIVKGIEFQFDDQKGWQTLVDAIESREEVSLGGFTLKGRGTLPNYTSPKYVSLSNPCVLAVRIDRQPKSPDPDPTIEW